VHEVSHNVDHDVPVVAVLDLKDITDQTVASEGAAEVITCLLELFRFLIPKLLVEIVHKPRLLSHLLLDAIDRLSV
jgi:hypothetical protein